MRHDYIIYLHIKSLHNRHKLTFPLAESDNNQTRRLGVGTINKKMNVLMGRYELKANYGQMALYSPIIISAAHAAKII